MRRLLALLLVAASGGCGGAPTRGATATATATAMAGPRGPRAPLHFAFAAVDGRPISTDAFVNRVTVIGLLTTYDVPSQVEARFLGSLERRHTPRLNVAALMLEAPENKPLVQAFALTLGVAYPVGIADADTIAGEGPFAGLHQVPSVVILDRDGREAFRHVGFIDEVTLEAAVRAVEKQ
jgi:hypothetical protein